MRSRTMLRFTLSLLFTAFFFTAGPTLAKKPPKPPPPPPTDPDPAIAFSVMVKQGKTYTSYLKVMNDDGTNLETVTTGAGRCDWSPDGTRLGYWGVLDGDYTFFTIDPDGTDRTNEGYPGAGGTPFAWCPKLVDGKNCIVFVQRASMNDTFPDLYLWKFGDDEPTRLTNTPLISEAAPTWSPSGDRIACKVYQWRWDANLAIYVVDDQDEWGLYTFSDGGGTFEVKQHQGDLQGMTVVFPSWAKTSANADKIVWGVYDEDAEDYDLWLTDIDGENGAPVDPVRLTNTSDTFERYCSWSEDDTKIVLLSEKLGGKGITTKIDVMDADGDNRETIVDEAGYVPPVWRR